VFAICTIGERKGYLSKETSPEKAIHASNGELILTTDAERIVTTTWIEKMVEASLMMYPWLQAIQELNSTTGPMKAWCTSMSTLTRRYLYGLGGGYTIGRSWACIGQNLAYRRAAFDDVGGFDQIRHLISGDDVNLMQLMRRKGHKIIFNFNQSLTYILVP
jgi:GT2 family glycosyltransferase